LSAALIGALVLEWVSLKLVSEGEYALLVMGAILVSVMLLAPTGVVTTISDLIGRLRADRAQPEIKKR
jgi:ABC-type branched-subunit amino acid transport system permease subunit